MVFGTADLSEIIKIYLIEKLHGEYLKYIECRNSGISSWRSFERANRILKLFYSTPNDNDSFKRTSNLLWEKELKSFAGCTIVFSCLADFVLNDYQFVLHIDSSVLIVTIDDFIDTEIEFPDHFSALQLPNTKSIYFDNPYLRTFFPTIHKIANSASWLLSILRPQKVVIYERKNINSLIVKCLAESLNIPIIFRDR